MWPLNGFINLSRFCVDKDLGIRSSCFIFLEYIVLHKIYRFVFPLFHRDNIDISGPAKPGTTRKMLGSPRQLENAVPTSKNPHGVWVWRQKRAAQWWGGLHSPQSTRPQRKLAGAWRWSWWYIWLWKVGPAAAQMKVIYTPGSPHQPLNIWTFTYQREVIFENLRHQNRDQTDASMILDRWSALEGE